MEKQKRWQLYLILAVIILTLYNILPTIFYYSKPLSAPIDGKRAHEEALSIVSRVNSLEDDAKAWLGSFSKLLGVKPAAIALKENDPQSIEVTFKNSDEASLFKRFLPRAGALIPFVPAQLELDAATANEKGSKVVVLRQVGVHLDPANVDSLFQFAPKYAEDEKVSPFYRDLINDRLAQLAISFAGPSATARQLAAVTSDQNDENLDDIVIALAKELVEIEKTFGKESPIAKRLFANFSQNEQGNGAAILSKYVTRADALKTKLTGKIDKLLQEQKDLKEKGSLLSTEQSQALSLLTSQRSSLDEATTLLSKSPELFKSKKALSFAQVQTALKKSAAKSSESQDLLNFNLSDRNPIVQGLIVDWANDKIVLQLYGDVVNIRQSSEQTEAANYRKEKLNQLAINEIARASRLSDETLAPSDDSFAVSLNTLSNTSGVLAFDLGQLASIKSQQISEQLKSGWQPQHPDLVPSNFPVHSYDAYKKLSKEDQQLGLVIYTPGTNEAPLAGFKNGSIYIIARGLDAIIQKYQQSPNAPENQQLVQDVNQLTSILQQNGFIGYSAAAYGLPQEYSKDYIFELDDYYSNLLKATREEFPSQREQALCRPRFHRRGTAHFDTEQNRRSDPRRPAQMERGV